MSEYNELNVEERLKIAVNSFMSKEEFITMLEKINFKAIESCNLNLITDIVYDENVDKITTRTKSISID